MSKETIFKIISIIIIPILFIEIFLNILYLFRQEINPIIRDRIATILNKNTDVKIKEMWKEYSKAGKFDHLSHVSHKRSPYKGNYINIDINRNRHTVNPTITDSSLLKTVWFFGGSTMWGTGAENDSVTIPSLVIQMLNESDNNFSYKGINFGESGYTSTSSLIQLLISLRNDKPDFIIFLDGVNDCGNSFTSGLPDVESNYLIKKYIVENKKDPDYSISKIIYFMKRFGLVKSVRHKIYYKENLNLDQKIAEIITSNWGIVNDLCNIQNIGFHAFLQPNALVGDYAKKYTPDSKMKSFYKSTYKNVISKNIKKKYFHDLSNIMPIEYKYFYDGWCHTSSIGNIIIAKSIVSKFNEKIYY